MTLSLTDFHYSIRDRIALKTPYNALYGNQALLGMISSMIDRCTVALSLRDDPEVMAVYIEGLRTMLTDMKNGTDEGAEILKLSTEGS